MDVTRPVSRAQTLLRWSPHSVPEREYRESWKTCKVKGLVVGAFGEVSEAGCLLSRLGSVGEGYVEVGRRKTKVVRWERRWQKEMMSMRQGRMVVRRGEFKED